MGFWKKFIEGIDLDGKEKKKFFRTKTRIAIFYILWFAIILSLFSVNSKPDYLTNLGHFYYLLTDITYLFFEILVPLIPSTLGEFIILTLKAFLIYFLGSRIVKYY